MTRLESNSQIAGLRTSMARCVAMVVLAAGCAWGCAGDGSAPAGGEDGTISGVSDGAASAEPATGSEGIDDGGDSNGGDAPSAADGDGLPPEGTAGTRRVTLCGVALKGDVMAITRNVSVERGDRSECASFPFRYFSSRNDFEVVELLYSSFDELESPIPVMTTSPLSVTSRLRLVQLRNIEGVWVQRRGWPVDLEGDRIHHRLPEVDEFGRPLTIVWEIPETVEETRVALARVLANFEEECGYPRTYEEESYWADAYRDLGERSCPEEHDSSDGDAPVDDGDFDDGGDQ